MKSEIRVAGAKLITDDGGVWLALRLPFASRESARAFADNFSPIKQYSAILKDNKPPRSLDQNAYYWTLCGKLSEVLKISPVDIYKEHIKDVGGNFDVVPIKIERKDKFIEIWEHSGDGFIAVDMGKSKIPGYTNIRAYVGSSTYDTAQMSKLLDLMIRDCKENNIETLSPEYIAQLEANCK